MKSRSDETETAAPEPAGREAFAYDQAPRPVGFPVSFRLKG